MMRHEEQSLSRTNKSLPEKGVAAGTEAEGKSAYVPGGTLVLAATPIGNVGDASTRLAALLESADLVAAEDTRRLYDLANRLGVRVSGRVVAYHDHNEDHMADPILDQVSDGACALVVSDAGMPTINDPGMSGLPTDRFCYEGFLPRRHSERLRHLRSLRNEPRTMVFYETTHRIDQAMEDLEEVFGADRPMALCRELTKDHEQVRRGTLAQIVESLTQDPPRGEMVLVVAGADPDQVRAESPEVLSDQALAALAKRRADEEGIRIKDAIAQVVAEHPLPDGSLPNRKKVYAATLDDRQEN